MPIIEAIPDETQMMKYKLVTLPKGTARIPIVDIGATVLNLQGRQRVVVSPTTINFTNGNIQYGYTAILTDSDVAEIRVTRAATNQAGAPTVAQFIGDSEAAQSVTVSGMEFEIVAKEQLLSSKTTTVLFIGNETGGRALLTVNVAKLEVAVTAGAPGVQK